MLIECEYLCIAVTNHLQALRDRKFKTTRTTNKVVRAIGQCTYQPVYECTRRTLSCARHQPASRARHHSFDYSGALFNSVRACVCACLCQQVRCTPTAACDRRKSMCRTNLLMWAFPQSAASGVVLICKRTQKMYNKQNVNNRDS